MTDVTAIRTFIESTSKNPWRTLGTCGNHRLIKFQERKHWTVIHPANLKHVRFKGQCYDQAFGLEELDDPTPTFDRLLRTAEHELTHDRGLPAVVRRLIMYTHAELEQMTNPQLTGIYNDHVDKPIKKFSTKTEALRRVVNLLKERRELKQVTTRGRPRSSGPKISDLARELVLSYVGRTAMTVENEDSIVERVKAQFPKSKFNRTHVKWYASKLRQEGHQVPKAERKLKKEK